jgi:pilus assembly protein Flp/PilA
MLQDPVNVASSAANFNLELVQGQLPPLAQESQMISLYTNLAVRLQRNEKGATAVEYGIMVALIAVVIIVAVTLLGGTLDDMFTQTSCSISGGTYVPVAAGADAGTSSCTP